MKFKKLNIMFDFSDHISLSIELKKFSFCLYFNNANFDKIKINHNFTVAFGKKTNKIMSEVIK